MPQVVTVVIGAPLGRKQLKRRQLYAVQAIGRPAVTAVSGRERISVVRSRARAFEQRLDIDAATYGLLQYLDGDGQGRARGCTDCRVLRAQELFCLCAPRKQLGVEKEPAGVEFIPHAGRRDSGAKTLKQLRGEFGIEERPPRARVDRATRAT